MKSKTNAAEVMKKENKDKENKEDRKKERRMKIENLTKFGVKERKSPQTVARKIKHNILGVQFSIPIFTLRNTKKSFTRHDYLNI